MPLVKCRYRAVPTSSSARAGGQSLHRSFTFQAESRERGITRVGEKTTQLLVLQEVPNTFETILGSESGDEEDFVEAEDRSWPLKKSELQLKVCVCVCVCVCVIIEKRMC